jgi:hypothetical protein
MNRAGALYAMVILAMFPLFFSACNEDDLKRAGTIAKKVTLTKDRSMGVEIVFSDSAVVKAKGFAPILDQVSPSVGGKYQEMIKGVKITFFDPQQRTTGTLTSDYAIRKETEEITIFRRNVVVVKEGLTFNTEELTWDQRKKTFFSPRGIVTKPDGTILNAINFRAPEDFSTVDFEQGSGETFLKENPVQ